MNDTGDEGGHRTDRSYERITYGDLRRLAEISRQDRADLFARKPRYWVLEDRLVCVALCQGAALHLVDGENGVKDFDVWRFYAARPEDPAYPWRRRVSRVFGDRGFGLSPVEPGFAGRRVDLLGCSIEAGAEGGPAEILRLYLTEGRTATARALARKAAVLLEPSDRLGAVVWPPGQQASPPEDRVGVEF